MNVCVRLFAAARQIAGRDSVDVELPADATVAQLRRRLAGELPAASALIERSMFAIDVQYAQETDIIRPGAEVAWIPPVSGG